MGLKEITTAILREAEKTADNIRIEAKKKAEELLKKAEARVKELRHLWLRRAEAEAKARKDRILGTARLEARKELLAAKYRLLDKTIERALSSLRALPEEDYLKILEKQFLDLELPEGKVELLIAPEDKTKITSDFLKKIEKEFANKGRNISLEFSSSSRNISGGFVLRMGKMEFDNSFEARVKAKRGELEKELARILFINDR